MEKLFGIVGHRHSGKSTVASTLFNFYIGKEKNTAIIEYSQILIDIVNLWQANWKWRENLYFKNQESLALFFNMHLAGSLIQTLDDYLLIRLPFNKIKMETEDFMDSHYLLDYLHECSKNVYFFNEFIDDDDSKDRHRKILNWLGTFLRRKFGNNVIAREVGARVVKYKRVVDVMIVSGIRFLADCEPILYHRGILIRVIRPQIEAHPTYLDISSLTLNKITCDQVIINDADKNDLVRATLLFQHRLS